MVEVVSGASCASWSLSWAGSGADWTAMVDSYRAHLPQEELGKQVVWSTSIAW
jgi:hypothetical protein